MSLRLAKVTLAHVWAAQPLATSLPKCIPASIKMIGVYNMQSSIASMTQKLTLSDISDDFFFQAEDGIRDLTVTGVQTCALPICIAAAAFQRRPPQRRPERDHPHDPHRAGRQ